MSRDHSAEMSALRHRTHDFSSSVKYQAAAVNMTAHPTPLEFWIQEAVLLPLCYLPLLSYHLDKWNGQQLLAALLQTPISIPLSSAHLIALHALKMPRACRIELRPSRIRNIIRGTFTKFMIFVGIPLYWVTARTTEILAKKVHDCVITDVNYMYMALIIPTYEVFVFGFRCVS